MVFQFQNGTIKSIVMEVSVGVFNEFQFQNGTIKSKVRTIGVGVNI